MNNINKTPEFGGFQSHESPVEINNLHSNAAQKTNNCFQKQVVDEDPYAFLLCNEASPSPIKQLIAPQQQLVDPRSQMFVPHDSPSIPSIHQMGGVPYMSRAEMEEDERFMFGLSEKKRQILRNFKEVTNECFKKDEEYKNLKKEYTDTVALVPEELLTQLKHDRRAWKLLGELGKKLQVLEDKLFILEQKMPALKDNFNKLYKKQMNILERYERSNYWMGGQLKNDRQFAAMCTQASQLQWKERGGRGEKKHYLLPPGVVPGLKDDLQPVYELEGQDNAFNLVEEMQKLRRFYIRSAPEDQSSFQLEDGLYGNFYTSAYTPNKLVSYLQPEKKNLNTLKPKVDSLLEKRAAPFEIEKKKPTRERTQHLTEEMIEQKPVVQQQNLEKQEQFLVPHKKLMTRKPATAKKNS